MRELPEIEVLRRELEREIVGRKIKAVDVQVAAAVTRSRTKKVLADLLEGAKIESVRRRGLLLLIGLDDEAAAITIAFTQGASLRLAELGKDAEAFVVGASELDAALPELATMGFDALDEPMTWVKFAKLVTERAEPMKKMMLDPNFIAGMGDVYVDEVLFEAGIRYDRKSDSLSTQEMRRLYRSLIEVLHDAVKHRGSSIGANGFADLAGKPGEHQDHLQVYGRDGKLSPRSRTPIKKVKYDGHWTYYCDTQV